MRATPARTDVERFRTLVGERLGFQVDDDKLDQLAELLGDRLDACGCSRFSAYESRLAFPARVELRAIAERVTVGETHFFRHWDQFRAFAEIAVPERLAASHGRRRLSVLSAGCASGEELYSLAILLRQLVEPGVLDSLDSLDLRLVGIDVNPAMIARATRARYSAWALRETPSLQRGKYFHEEGRELRLDEAVRAMATFEERNLVDDDPTFWQPEAFDIVFCRNTMMYFRPEVMAAVVARLGAAIAPGGFLFLGHAETLRGISSEFQLRQSHETFYYQRRSENEAASVIARPSNDALVRESATPMSKALDLDDLSWVSAIQRASDRIAQLVAPPTPSGVRSVERSPDVEGAPHSLAPVIELLRQERYADAIALFRALPASSRDEPDAQLLSAVLLTHGGRLDAAEITCRQILANDDSSAGAHYVLALCREHAGDVDAARKHYETASYIDAEFAMPHLHLGLLARRAGDHERARTELARALTLLARENDSRIVLFGGGFSRESLAAMCRGELRACGGAS